MWQPWNQALQNRKTVISWRLWLEAQTVKAMLKRRGFEMLKYNPTEYLVFPPDWDSAFEDEL
jgi:hypothetical protein